MRKENAVMMISGLVVLGVSAYQTYKTKKIIKNLDAAVDTVDVNTQIDVSEYVVNKAIEAAVDREVGIAVNNATTDAIKKVNAEMYLEVKKNVANAYSDLKTDIKKRLEDQVTNVNINEIRDEVVDKAASDATKKFQRDLDDILEKYNKDLDNVSKIYSSIATSMTKRDGGATFKIV